MAILIGVINKKRDESFKNEGVESICKLIEIRKMSKGILSSQTVAFVEFFVDGKRLLKPTPAYDENTPIGGCYPISYLLTNPSVLEVDFKNLIFCDSLEVQRSNYQ